MRAKNRRGDSIKIDYLVHIQEIKPWPPSQSLRSLRSVMIQWENCDRYYGSTNVVVPILGSVVGEGRIEFNESLRLSVALVRDMVTKSGGGDRFKKNCMEFHLYEVRREKTSKGQLLASATIDLADYGVVREALCVNAQMNCKRSFGNTNQPVLYIKIQPVDKGYSSSLLRDSLSRGMSFDSTVGESVSALISEEHGEENEVASFTDDDISSQSSMTFFPSTIETDGALPPQNDGNGHSSVTQYSGDNVKERTLISGRDESSLILPNTVDNNLKGNSSSSSFVGHPSDPGSPVNDHASMNGSPESGLIHIQKNSLNNVCDSFCSSPNGTPEDDSRPSVKSNEPDHLGEEIREKSASCRDFLEEDTSLDTYNSLVVDKDDKEMKKDRQKLEKKMEFTSHETVNTKDADGRQDLSGSDIFPLGKENSGRKSNMLTGDRLQQDKSVRSSINSVGPISGQISEVKVDDALEHAHSNTGSFRSNEKDVKIYPKDTTSAILDSKIQQLQYRIKMLEGELREAAATEASLYSTVAEHGSSPSKVHAPARRLVRLYLSDCSRSQRASAARTAVSGLVLIAKACGNDVPRLTFWLSNSVVLRTAICQINGNVDRQYSVGSQIERKGNNISHQVNVKASSSDEREDRNFLHDEGFGNWGDPQTFILALEKFEAWIFSRIIESIWWQTLTPHMQSSAAKNVDQVSSPDSVKSYKRILSIDQEQGILSLGIWKNAFQDASDRICPVRAGGHECGCLHVLAKMIMEQCVARLDVAMFNAILRESGDEIPTDPMSDPISDSKVLPIPAGKSSLGAGALLKNAIGNWSRVLTDLFGMEDDDDQHGSDGDGDDRQFTCFKTLHLLNALSDLMMLPKDTLLDKTIRREVCPAFSSLVIKRVLHNFVPDEFCPDPVPEGVLEALDSEDPNEAGDKSITNFPCTAAPIVYLPPLAASLGGSTGVVASLSELRRSSSSLLRKSYTSDDELDELNSPLDSILMDSPRSSQAPTKPSWIPKKSTNQNATRYELLREIWKNSD